MPSKHKMVVEKTETPLEDLKQRIEMFIKLNQQSLDLGTLTQSEKTGLEYQNIGFGAVLILINQLLKRGAIWKGGYLDSTGVVYADQLELLLNSK